MSAPKSKSKKSKNPANRQFSKQKAKRSEENVKLAQLEQSVQDFVGAQNNKSCCAKLICILN